MQLTAKIIQKRSLRLFFSYFFCSALVLDTVIAIICSVHPSLSQKLSRHIFNTVPKLNLYSLTLLHEVSFLHVLIPVFSPLVCLISFSRSKKLLRAREGFGLTAKVFNMQMRKRRSRSALAREEKELSRPEARLYVQRSSS